MNSLFQKIAGAFFLVLFLGAVPAKAAMDTSANPSLVEADNRFGFKLFSELNRENFKPGKTPENVFISPASISWAFHMLLNGAAGGTLQALSAALETQGLTPESINNTNMALRSALEKADPQVQLSVANSLWGKEGHPFLPAFLSAAEQFYGAKIAPLKSADVVNAWVSEKTKGKITSILKQEDITPDALLFLINALYFKGAWERPFEKSLTAPKPFHLLDGKKKDHPMMQRSGRFRYYEDPQVQAVEIPYGNGRFSFYVLLPAASSTLKDFLQSFDAARFSGIVEKRSQRPGKIELPRFKIEYSAELADPLQTLGMKPAFTRQADFSKLATIPPGLWIQISSVKHKTYVDVNEEGTEAAAVTAIGMLGGSAPPKPETPFVMVVDRPFFAAIRDNTSGLLLFMGTIVQP